jgi:hypothetical protein
MQSLSSAMRLKKSDGSKPSPDNSHGNNSKGGALFPLPEGFFPKVVLDKAQVQFYEQLMQQIARDALAAYERHEDMGDQPSYCEPWRWMASVENLIAVQQPQSSRVATTKSRIFGRINGDFKQQMDFYYAETNKQLFEWNQVMRGNTVDAAVLCNIHTVISGKPHLYMGIKWVCVAAPRILTRKRDQLFLEYMTFTTDLHDREVGIRVTLPIDLPECPDLAKELNVKRVKSHTVTILRAAANDKSSTEFFQMAETDSAVNYVNAAHYKREMSVIKDMAIFVDSRRISQQSIRERDEWVPRAQRDACSICKRGFSTTRRHHHCRLCGEVICGSCTIVRKAHRKDKSVKTKVCLQCVKAIRESDSSSSSMDFSSTSGVKLSSESYNFSKCRIGDVSLRDSEVDDVDSWNGGASDWETESEGGDHSSRSVFSTSSSVHEVDFHGDEDDATARSSSGSTVSLSESSSTRGKHSFMTTLDVIEDHSEEHEVHELVDFSKDLECLMEGVTEVIDTKEMARVPTPLSSSYPDPHHQMLPPPRSMRFHSTHLSGASSSGNGRSIDQCLAEQEELLKRMVLAAGTVGGSSKSRTNSATRHE